MLGDAPSGLGSIATLDMGTVARIALGYAICLLLPNTQQILVNFRPILEKVSPVRGIAITWRPTMAWGAVMGALLLAALLKMSDVSKFLYFQF
jgi:hypothetical protein